MRDKFHVLNEEICLLLPVHDPVTNTNWIAELCGTCTEVGCFGLASAKFMDDAGFIPGWAATGRYCGSIPYIDLVWEAVKRCWRACFEMASSIVHH